MELLETALNIIGFFIALSIVVTVHEGGHFLAARWAGVEVEAFAIGWGKVLWSRRFGGTEFRICLLPLGGYCKMKGEQDLVASMGRGDKTVEASPGSLFAAKPWKKIVISVAGPLFNLIFALALFCLLEWTGSPRVDDPPRVELAAEVDGRHDLPAETAGLRTGDLVLSIDGTRIDSFSQLQETVAASNGRTAQWRIDRAGQAMDLTVTPKIDTQENRPLVGVYAFLNPVVGTVAPNSPAELAGFRKGDRVVAADGTPITGQRLLHLLTSAVRDVTVTVERDGANTDLLLIPDRQFAGAPNQGLDFEHTVYPAQPLPVLTALKNGWTHTWALLGLMGDGLVKLFTGQMNPIQALSGPIGMAKMSTEATTAAFAQSQESGWATLVRVVAFINLALFLMNLLPIPALDGGSIVVSLVEAARRRPLELRHLLRYQQIGAAVVLCLILFTTLNDLGIFGKH